MRNHVHILIAVIVFGVFTHSLPVCAASGYSYGTASLEADDRGLEVTGKTYDSRKRIALVIGNNSYRLSPLKNSVNDARVMAVALRRLGFEVEVENNLGYQEMLSSITAFGKKLRDGGIGLFYYAGHGMQVNGVNYLIPVDARIESEDEMRFKAVDAGMVLATMERSKSDLNLIILDACRNNPFSRSFRNPTLGLANIDAPHGSLIAYATAPSKTADDGDGRNGLYTTELVKVLETPGITLEEVFGRTLKAVQEKSGYKQNPLIAANLEGEFYFIPPSTVSDMPSSSRGAGLLPDPSEGYSRSGDSQSRPFGMDFVNVPGGCFQMGDVFGDGESDEKPVHEVCLSNYAIGKFEVTQSQWRRVMGSNPSRENSRCDTCPVENVSWYDAQEFIRRVNSVTGETYRLPTEAEWEYAARSGGKNEKFSGGADGEAVAWYKGNSLTYSHSVGQKQPNGLGIHDMSGNVWEWVSDWYDSDYFTKSSLNDPEGPSSGSYRVLRGGSWGSSTKYIRTSDRFRIVPDNYSINLGFRLVRPAKR